MSRVVIILGAGCSKEAGAPLMNDFMARAQDLYFEKGRLEENFRSEFKTVFEAIGELHPANTKSRLNVRNLESIWSAFEMAKQIGRLGSLTGDNATKPFHSIRSLILETLEKSIRFPLHGEGDKRLGQKWLEAPVPYEHLATLISKLQEIREVDVSIMSFNYDICVEFALMRVGIEYNYCLNDQPRSGLPFLKLHGSLNWIHFQEPEIRVVSYDVGKILECFNFMATRGAHVFLPIRTALTKLMTSQGEAVTNPTLPFIVPPSLSKTEAQGKIFPVWKRACEELMTAQNILVFGYSLPENDNFFRYLYSLGTISDTMLKRFWVFDPSKDLVEARYKQMLGQYALDCFRVFPMTFREALPFVIGEVNKKDADPTW